MEQQKEAQHQKVLPDECNKHFGIIHPLASFIKTRLIDKETRHYINLNGFVKVMSTMISVKQTLTIH